MPTITLAMIVKNVEKFISNSLASTLPFVDEVVVVDTGSSDRTKAVIRNLVETRGLPFKLLDFNHETHPKGFLFDATETWDGKMPGPFTNEYMLADFGAARQLGWEQATSDYIIWIDSDDVLENGPNLGALLDDMQRDGVDTALLNYDYASDAGGNVTCKLYRERVSRRGGPARWNQVIHEVLCPTGVTKVYDIVNVKHRRYEYRLPPLQHNRNLKVLTKWFEGKDKDSPGLDARMLFYLGMEERFVWPERAVETFKKYCSRSGWDEERGAAHMLAGSILEHAGKLEEAFAEFAQAAMEFRWNPDPWFGAARNSYFKQDWFKCIERTERGFELAKQAENGPRSVLMHDPLDRSYRPYIYYAASLVNAQQLEKSIEACKQGLKSNPGDPHLKGNLEYAEKCLREQNKIPAPGEKMAHKLSFRRDEPLETPSIDIPFDVMIGISLQIWKKVSEGGPTKRTAYQKALVFLDSLPAKVSGDEKIQKARRFTEERILGTATAAHVEIPALSEPPILVPAPAPVVSPGARRLLKIGIWTGWAWEPWSPKSIETGIGGSETAAICMARELAKLGHHVQAYANCKGMEGVYDGVEYIHWETAWAAPDTLDHDVLVVSRQVEPLRRFTKVKSKVLWVHDINVGSASEVGDSLDFADLIFCLSEWHKEYFLSCYPILKKKNKILVTRNGIDLNRFDGDITKKTNRLIYTSSPDRGLTELLRYFTQIKKEVTDAELHVYYGFKTWLEMAKARGSIASLKQIQDLQDAIASTPGVFFHDRVGQKELAQAFMESKIWGFPTWFTETSCCHPDTLISVPGDHRTGMPCRVRIADLVGKKNFPVYAFDPTEKRFKISTALWCAQTKVADEMVELELDDGSRLKVTPEHLLMNFDGDWVEAGKYRPGDRLTALHHRYDVMIKDHNGRWTSESRLMGEWMEGRRLTKDEHVDHLDPLRLDNRAEALQVLSRSDHFKKTHAGKDLRRDQKKATGTRFSKWIQANLPAVTENNKKNGKNLWEWVRSLPDGERLAWLRERSEKKKATFASHMRDPVYAESVRSRARIAGAKGAAVRWNHRVVNTRRIPGGPVFDMEVEGVHNFIAEGVVVHNCISAMEAQAAGCVPVVTKLAALEETVKAGYLLDGLASSEEYGKKFVSQISSLLRDEGARQVIAQEARKQAFASFSWESLAPEWEGIFVDVLGAKSRELIPGRVFSPAPRPFDNARQPVRPLLMPPDLNSPVTRSKVHVPRPIAPATDRPMRIAVILGVQGKSVHGVMDVDNLFDDDSAFVTGTVSGFFNIAWGLGERGHQVDAFCDAKENVIGSRFGRVNFYQYGSATIGTDYDAYISVNEPDILRGLPENKLRVCAFWLNDFVLCQRGWDEFVDVYACPSQAHSDYLATASKISRDKMDIIPLSINSEFYGKAVARRPYSMAYCSSPDRGLHVLLEMFPEIRLRVPEANLRIYYRFRPWLDAMLADSSQMRDPSYERALSINDSLIRLGHKGENGVTLVGPLPPKKMIDELRATRILAYPCSPTRFTEGFSVSIMDASMAGCVPIISGVDALSEIYGGAAHVIHGLPTEQREEWVDALCLALTDDGFASEIRMRSQAHALNFTRQKVAAQWEKLLREKIK